MKTLAHRKSSLTYFLLFFGFSLFSYWGCSSSEKEDILDSELVEEFVDEDSTASAKDEDSSATIAGAEDVGDYEAEEEGSDGDYSEEETVEADDKSEPVAAVGTESDEDDEFEDEEEAEVPAQVAALPSPADLDKKISESKKNPGAPGPDSTDDIYVASDDKDEAKEEEYDELAAEVAEVPPAATSVATSAPAPSVTLPLGQKEIYYVTAKKVSLLASAGGASSGVSRIRGDRVAVVAVEGKWAHLDNNTYVAMSAISTKAVAYARVAKGWSK